MMFHLVRKDQEIFNIAEAEEYVKHDVQYLKKEAILSVQEDLEDRVMRVCACTRVSSIKGKSRNHL